MVVVDSTFLIDLIKGVAAAENYLGSLSIRPVASEISRVEVLRGLRSHERNSAERLMSDMQWIAVNEEIARRAGELGRRYRASHSGIGIADLVVAATAQVVGQPVATANVRHFPMCGGLEH